jgi:vancomycin resistance protein VanW
LLNRVCVSERESDVDAVTGWLRATRRRAHQGARLSRWMLEAPAFPRPIVAPDRTGFPHRVFLARVPLVGTGACGEPILEAGKRINVALAAPSFDGVVVTPERPLSFWRTLGHPGPAQGFRPGVEIRGGCLIPSIGGGLCLVSNVLFALGARLGWTIHERHGHSADVSLGLPGDPWGLDATVLWPHLDLRIAPTAGAARLAMAVRGEVLEVAADATTPAALDVALTVEDERTRRTAGGLVRENRVLRSLHDRATGRLLAREVLAENRKRVTDPAERRRTCMSCDETSCGTGIVALRRTR